MYTLFCILGATSYISGTLLNLVLIGRVEGLPGAIAAGLLFPAMNLWFPLGLLFHGAPLSATLVIAIPVGCAILAARYRQPAD